MSKLFTILFSTVLLIMSGQAWSQSCTDSRDCPVTKGVCAGGQCVGFQVTSQASNESIRTTCEMSLFSPTSREVELPSESLMEIKVIQADGSIKSKFYNMMEISSDTITTIRKEE